MRALIVFCLVGHVLSEGFQNGHVAVREERSTTDVPHLRGIISDLSILSRILNGIAIQNAIIQKPASPDQLLAELLNVHSGPILTDLNQNSDLEKLVQDLPNIQTIVQAAAGKSDIPDVPKVQKTNAALKSLISDRMKLETASKPATTDALRAAAPDVVDSKIDVKLLKDSRIPDISKALKEALEATEPAAGNTEALKAVITPILELHKNIKPELATYITDLKAYKTSTSLKPLIDFLPLVDSLKHLELLKKTYKLYQDLQLQLVHSHWSKLAPGETTRLTNVQTAKDALEAFQNLLLPVLPMIRSLQEPTKQQDYTLGLGTSNLTKTLSNIFTLDFKDPWVLEKLTEGKPIDALQNKTQKLQDFTQKITALEGKFKAFLDLLKPTDPSKPVLLAFNRVKGSLQQLVTDAEKLRQVTDLPKFITDSTACLQPLAALTTTIDIAAFEDRAKFLKDLVADTKNNFAILDTLIISKSIENTAVLDAVSAAIPPAAAASGMQMTKDQAWSIITAIQAIPKIKEFSQELETVATGLAQVSSSQMIQLLAKKLDFTVLNSMVDALKDTKLLPMIDCMKRMNFNRDPIKRLLKIQTTAAKISSEDLASIKTILDSLKTFKTEYAQVQGFLSPATTTSTSRRRRAQSPEDELLKLTNSMAISQQLAQGLKVLTDMTRVIDKKEDIQKITAYGDPIDSLISQIQIPPMIGIWTPESREALGKVIQDIEALEPLAQTARNMSLVGVFGILENGTKVLGVPAPFKAEFLNEPISTELAASSDQNAQAAAPVFQGLSDLELDFASHQDVLQAAFATLTPIRSFLDGLFGIDRSPPTTPNPAVTGGDQGDKSGNGTEPEAEALYQVSAKKDDSLFLYACAGAGALLFTILLIVLCCCCLKKSRKNARLNNPETWRHLAFLPEGELKKTDDTKYTLMHLAVKKNKLEEVKKRVKNGAYVNVYSTGRMIETPLHTAVANNKPEMVELLIKNGADMKALDSNYESPRDKAKGKPAVMKLLKKYENKEFKKRLPQELPANKYKVFVDKDVKGLKEFCKSFKSNIVEKISSATHIVVKTNKDGVLDLDHNDGAAQIYLNRIFSPQILMSSEWISESFKSRKAFANDWEYRVNKIKFKGKVYKNVDDIQESFQKMKITYLTNSIVHLNQGAFSTVDWGNLKETCTNLGATLVDEFPVMQGMLPGQHPYYRDDLGHIFVVYMSGNSAELESQYPYLRTEKSYTFLERDEFIGLLLDAKISNNIKKGGGKAPKSKDSVTNTKSKSKDSRSGGSKERVSGSQDNGFPPPAAPIDFAPPDMDQAPPPAVPDAPVAPQDPYAPPQGGLPPNADPWAV